MIAAYPTVLVLLSILIIEDSTSFTHRGLPMKRRIIRVRMSGRGDEDNKKLENDEKDGNSNAKEGKNLKNSMSLVEYAERERQAARKLENRLLLPNRIGRAINIALYAFVIFGFLLNLSGFAYVRTNDGIRIGTLEEQQFQMEINRVVKPPPKMDDTEML